MSTRRARGEIPAAVLTYLDDEGLDGVRYTPYFIAKALGLSPGSVTAACKTLATEGKVHLYGSAPYMIGRLP